MCELWSCAQLRVTVLRPSQAFQLAWLDDQMNLTVRNLSSEQDRLSTTVMMVLLLKYEVPARLNFISKTTTAFCVRVFCHASELFNFTISSCTVTPWHKVSKLSSASSGPPLQRTFLYWLLSLAVSNGFGMLRSNYLEAQRPRKKERTAVLIFDFALWVTTVKTRRWTSVTCDLWDLWPPNRKKVSSFQVPYLMY